MNIDLMDGNGIAIAALMTLMSLMTLMKLIVVDGTNIRRHSNPTRMYM